MTADENRLRSAEAKPPIVLYRERVTICGVSYVPVGALCGECLGGVWRTASFGDGPGALDAALGAADSCCHPQPCQTCDTPIARGSWCHPCRVKADAARDQRDYDKARKVPLAESDATMVTDGEDFWTRDDVVDDDTDHALVAADGTRFLWSTAPTTASVDLERACDEDWLEEHHEDASDWVDWPKIRQAQALVDEALKGIVTYHEDRSVAVVLPKEEAGDGGKVSLEAVCIMRRHAAAIAEVA